LPINYLEYFSVSLEFPSLLDADLSDLGSLPDTDLSDLGSFVLEDEDSVDLVSLDTEP